jgi:hypothetical protein
MAIRNDSDNAASGLSVMNVKAQQMRRIDYESNRRRDRGKAQRRPCEYDQNSVHRGSTIPR